jgi:Tfp pilus assembly protein PilN
MYRELTNLLPPDRSRAFRREYFLHLATVSVVVLALLVIAHGLLLLPTYLSLTAERTAQSTALAKLDTNLQAADQRDIGQRVAALTSDAAYLAKLGSLPTASSLVRAILLVPHDGITLTGISFTPPLDASAGHLLLTGEASTRDTLRAYDLALAALPFVKSAELPISAYAKETDIPFTISVSGPLNP